MCGWLKMARAALARWSIGFLVLLGCGASAQPVADLAAKMQAVKATLKSAYVSYRAEDGMTAAGLENLGASGSPTVVDTMKQWAMQGEDELLRTTNGPSTENIFTHGGRGRMVTQTQIEGSPTGRMGVWIPKDAFGISSPLDYGYRMNSGPWLADMVQAGVLGPKGQTTDERFGKLLLLQGKDGRGTTYRASLATEHGYIAVNIAEEFDDRRMAWTVDSVRTVNGFVLPEEAHYELVKITRKGSTPLEHRKQQLLEAQVNTLVPAELFVPPKLQPGATVKDEPRGISYEIGPNGEEIFRGYIGKTPQAGQSTGVMQWGWAFIASVMAALLLGVRLMVVRRRPGSTPPK